MRKKIIVLLIVSIIYILFFPLYKNKVLDAKYVIKVEVSGTRNSLSQGTEIWINYITQDGSNVDINSLVLEGNWENRGRLYNPGTEASVWTILVHSKEKTEINFVTHPYSGIVKIIDYKGNIMEVDLFSEKEGNKSIVLDY